MTAQCKRVVTLNLKPLDCLPLEMLKRRRQYPRILVYDPIPPVCQPSNEPIFSAPGTAMGVTIKVCNYSRLCQACRPPPLCDCKPIPPPLPPGKLLANRIKYLTKLAAFLVIIKWFYDIGLLGDQREAKKLSDHIKEQLNNFFYTRRGCVQSESAKYDMARITYNLKNVWNMTVASIIRTLESIPPALATIPAYIYPTRTKEPCDQKKPVKKAADKKAPKKADKKDDKKAADKKAPKKDDKKAADKKAPKKDDKKAADKKAPKKDDKKAADKKAPKKDDKKAADKKAPKKDEKKAADKKAPKKDEKAADKKAPKKDEKKAADKKAPKKDEKKAADKKAPKKDEKKAADKKAPKKEPDKVKPPKVKKSAEPEKKIPPVCP